MYYRMDRAVITLDKDPCAGGICDCRSYDAVITIINPLFLKLMTLEGPFDILSHYSAGVFRIIKSLIEEDFVKAATAHLVPVALQEVYVFRQQMQVRTNNQIPLLIPSVLRRI